MSRVSVLVLALLALVTGLPSDPPKPFHGHQVLDIPTETEHHKDVLGQLVDEHKLDVWRHPRSYGDTMSVRVQPEYINRVVSFLNQHGLNYRIKIRDVQVLVDEEAVSMAARRSKRATSFDRFNYHKHGEINEFMATLASQCSMCKIVNIGKSLYGRNMDVLVLSKGSNKPAIFIDGGIHAREWISPATVINIFYALIYDPNLADLTDLFDWHFLPVANPDGYDYSHDTDRMWRKTRSLYQGYYGADPNRNFAYRWGHIGASSNPRDETFRGTAPFSEIETANMAAYLTSHKEIKAYLTFHSYGQYFLYPWGYERCVSGSPVDDAELRKLANVAINAIRNENNGENSIYKVGPSGCVLYPAAGGSDDWTKGEAGIKYSYTVELPDTGRYGFILPPRFIESVSIETIAGMREFARELIKDL